MNEKQFTEKQIRDVIQDNIIHKSYDLNIVDLGMVYNVEIKEGEIGIDFSPTSPDDPKTGSMASEIEQLLRDEFDSEVEVNLISEPEWSPDMMTESARKSFLE